MVFTKSLVNTRMYKKSCDLISISQFTDLALIHHESASKSHKSAHLEHKIPGLYCSVSITHFL